MAGPTKTAGSFSRHAIVRPDAPVDHPPHRTAAAELRETDQRQTVKNTIGVSGMTIRPKKMAIGETAIRNAAALATERRPSRISDEPVGRPHERQG